MSWPNVTDSGGVVWTTSGRAAIFLALRALGVKPGDRVLVPTYHCPTMIAPAVHLGAMPVFFSITATGGPDLAYLRTLDTSGVKALLVAHYFGLAQPVRQLRRFCDERGIALIEDCAHAFFGESEDLPIGATGDVAIASLSKFFPVTEGGCLVARRSLDAVRPAHRSWRDSVRLGWDAVELGARYRRLAWLDSPVRALAAAKDLLRGRNTGGLQLASDPTDDSLAGLTQIDEAQAQRSPARITRWLVEAADVERIVTNRRRNFALFDSLLSDCARAWPLANDLPTTAVPYVFPLRVKNPEPVYRRIRARGVPVFRWDIAWPQTPEIPGDVGLTWAREIFQLACHQDMEEADVRLVAHELRAILDVECE